VFSLNTQTIICIKYFQKLLSVIVVTPFLNSKRSKEYIFYFKNIILNINILFKNRTKEKKSY